MKYKSCRGGGPSISFQEAIFSGYAADGGMLLPETLPKISKHQLQAWSRFSYVDLIKKILPYFISPEEIPTKDLENLVDRTFANKFPRDPLPMVSLAGGKLFIQEMFHGPTGAFKDLSLCMIGALYDYFLQRQSRRVTVVVGTSGDTGSAAIYAVKDLKSVDIIVLYPKGRISKVQEQQMITHPEPNVHVYSVDGTSDDLDVPCRKVLSDVPFRTHHKLASINSPNVGRIIMQIVHFFYAYLYVTRETLSENVTIAIPTGACGNLVCNFLIILEVG